MLCEAQKFKRARKIKIYETFGAKMRKMTKNSAKITKKSTFLGPNFNKIWICYEPKVVNISHCVLVTQIHGTRRQRK